MDTGIDVDTGMFSDLYWTDNYKANTVQGQKRCENSRSWKGQLNWKQINTGRAIIRNWLTDTDWQQDVTTVTDPAGVFFDF